MSKKNIPALLASAASFDEDQNDFETRWYADSMCDSAFRMISFCEKKISDHVAELGALMEQDDANETTHVNIDRLTTRIEDTEHQIENAKQRLAYAEEAYFQLTGSKWKPRNRVVNHTNAKAKAAAALKKYG